jgi:hypothetical protein
MQLEEILPRKVTLLGPLSTMTELSLVRCGKLDTCPGELGVSKTPISFRGPFHFVRNN